jgi:hypothetical protein
MKKIIGSGIAAISAAIGIAAFPAGSAHAYVDEEFLACPDGHSGIATTVTSCPFAENVRVAWYTQSGQVVEAYSPVTNMFYDMQCADGFIAHLNTGRTVPSVRCVGGNDAVVVLL